MCIPESFTPLVRLLPHDFVIILVGAQPALSHRHEAPRTPTGTGRDSATGEIHPSWIHAVNHKEHYPRETLLRGYRIDADHAFSRAATQPNQTPTYHYAHSSSTLDHNGGFHKLGRGSVSSLQRPSHTQNLHTFVARKIRSVHAVPDWEQH